MEREAKAATSRKATGREGTVATSRAVHIRKARVAKFGGMNVQGVGK